VHLSGVILPNEDGDILLIHRATPRRTQWEIPGGKIESDEDPAGAAAREALEELGVEVRIVRELGSASFEEDGHTIMYTWFLGDTNSTEPTIGEPDKYDGIRYWPVNELGDTSETISPNTANFVRHLNAGLVKL
jgi:8-oxo-dGTP pyrophosphatase MutT (NUDIX family)